MFSFGGDPRLVERTGTSVIVDANGDNEVLLDEPTVQILQGQTTTIPRKKPVSLPGRVLAPLQLGVTQTANTLLNQLQHTATTPSSVVVQPAPIQNENPNTTGDSETSDPDTPTDPVITDPEDPTAGGDTGGIIVDDEELTTNNQSTTGSNTSVQQSTTDTQLQGSQSATTEVTL